MKRLVMLGPPASGKGTQGERLARHLDVPHVASGEILRGSIENGDPQGISGLVARGQRVPDEIVEALLFQELGDAFVLDGYPRTARQAERLDDILAKRDTPLDSALELTLGEGALVARMVLRKYEERRTDDEPEVFIKRIEDYRGHAAELRDHYDERLVTVEADGSEEEVFERLRKALENGKRKD